MTDKHEPLRMAIVGAGPAGLVLALALARRTEIAVTVFDRLPSHLAAETYNPDRSYTIDITGHGIRALKYIGSIARMDRVTFARTRARTDRSQSVRSDVPTRLHRVCTSDAQRTRSAYAGAYCLQGNLRRVLRSEDAVNRMDWVPRGYLPSAAAGVFGACA